MPTLDLQLFEPGEDPFSDAVFPVVKRAIESGNETDLRSASQEITSKLIEFKRQGKYVTFNNSFDPLCLEMAEQIPYDSDRMLDVLRLLELVHSAPELASHTAQDDPLGYNDLAQSLWEFWDGWREEDAARCINWHAFVSHIYVRGLVQSALAPVTSLAEVLENTREDIPAEKGLEMSEALAMAASQYIYRWGEPLLNSLLTMFNSSSPSFDKKAYAWAGSGAQGLQKWHIWRDSLQRIAAGGWDESGKSVRAQYKDFFTNVADLMDGIEVKVTSSEILGHETAEFGHIVLPAKRTSDGSVTG